MARPAPPSARRAGGRSGCRRRGTGRRRRRASSGSSSRSRSTSSRRPKRRMVIWKGRGGRRAKRDRLAVDDESPRGQRAHRFHQLGHRRGHLVEARGCRPRPRRRSLWIWTRAPSSLYSKRGLAQLGERLADVVGAVGQHRLHRAEQLHARSARARPRRLGQRRGRPARRSPASITARRTSRRRPARGARHRLDHAAPRARPGAARRVSSPPRNRCSSAVSRSNSSRSSRCLVSAEPLPDVLAIASRTACTSESSTEGESAARSGIALR